MMKISVIIPTHNRHAKILETVENLCRQDFPADDYEIIVVDDGSTPPVVFREDFSAMATKVSVIRLEGEERSVARNTGAKNARGEFLVFIDDDISVGRDFLKNYWRARSEFPNALFVGSIILPEESLANPFVRFRQNLENSAIPRARGEIAQKNFCAAGNMGIENAVFHEISGFDARLTSSEDQDFALRHTACGGKIIFLPEARGIHYDNALSIRDYCRRNEWGSRLMKPFYLRYPELPDNIERARVNGAPNLGAEPLRTSVRKILKSVIASPPIVNLLFLMTDFLERKVPRQTGILGRLYNLLLGAHILRGYRAVMPNSDARKTTAT